MTERRQTDRTEFDVLVNKSLVSKAPIKNISEKGICITTTTALSIGDIVVLDFSLPNNNEIKAYGKIKWSKEASEGIFINGLEFWHLEQDCQDKIINFVKEKAHYIPASHVY
ncbi:MAG: PilZ domain-containing protein [Spirochaetales bacterium]|nr:PilZ domain-containing protein [Spirochaetales bacterium]